MDNNIPDDLVPVGTIIHPDDLPADVQPHPIMGKLTVGEAQFEGDDSKQTISPFQQLDPSQQRRYFQELQATPLPVNVPEQSTARQVAGGLLRPFTGLAAGVLKETAGKRGDIYGQDDPFKQALDRASENTLLFGQETQPGAASGGAGLGANAVVAATPGGPAILGLNAAANRLYGAQFQQELGQAPDEHFALRAIAEGGIEYAVNQLMQTGMTSNAAKALISKVAPSVGRPIAATAVRTAIGGTLMGGSQALQNIAGGRPIGEGVLPAAATGGLMENIGGALHDVLSPAIPKAAPAPEATPAAPPTEAVGSTAAIPQPAVTKAETSSQATGAAPGTPERLSEISSPGPVTQRTGLDELMGKAKALLADESGGEKATQKFVQRVVAPAAQTWWTSIKKTATNVNRFLGIGLGEGAEEQRVGRSIRESGANQELDRIRTEEQFQPFRERVGEFPDKFKTQWVEAIESGQPVPDAETQGAADFLRRLNNKNRVEADQVGLDTSKWDSNDDYVGRMAIWPQQEVVGPGGKKSIAGPEHYLKGRVFDTYGQFKAAVEESGGKMRYDNPIDVMLAKQQEVRQSIEARKLIQQEQARGTVKEIKYREPLPEGYQYLDDKLATTRAKRYSAPAKYAGILNDTTTSAEDRIALFKRLRMQGDLNELPPTPRGPTVSEGGDLQEQQRTALHQEQALPGFPPGHMVVDPILSRLADTGRLAAPEGIANKLNQYIAPGIGKAIPIWDRIVQAKRASVGLNFSWSAFHVPMESVGNAYLAIGQALGNNLPAGEYKLAFKNLKRALPWEQVKFGADIREQAKTGKFDPGLQPLVDASTKAGQRFSIRSVLDATTYQKAQTAFAEGDPISGVARMLQAGGERISSPIMEKFVPNMKAGAMGMYAETLLNRGLTGEALHEALTKAGDNVDNVLGQVVRSNQFQHKVVTDLMDGIFAAPKFTEGALRFGGAAVRDTVQALSDAAQGKKVTLTPAMHTVLGFAVTTAALGSAFQLAYSTATTGKPIMPSSLKDMFFPRTGRKNQDGTDERLSLPNPMSFLTSVVTEGPSKAVVNRLAPIWRSIMDVVQNSDYKNVQVREGNALQQTGQSLKHVAKSQLPFSMQNLVEAPSGQQTLDLKALAGLGIRKAPSSVAHSAAENKLFELTPSETRTQEQAAKSDIKHKIVGELRQPGGRAQAFADQRAALKAGTLTNKDVNKLQEEAQQPVDFVQRLKNSNLPPDQLMDVWDKMTPDEKKRTAWVLRNKINNSTVAKPEDVRTYLRQINADLKPKE